jgi:hypothetical protein
VATIFISYRREDSGGHAGRLCDRLSARFGDARVFMDLQDIEPGQNFVRSIEDVIGTCECVVAVLGPRWVEALQRRSPDAEDFVRHEIRAALARGIPVVPVLVGGAGMPSMEELPPELAPLRQRNAFAIRDERFDDDVARLGDAIASYVGKGTGETRTTVRRTTRSLVAVAAAVVLAAAVAATYLSGRPAEPELAAPVARPPVLDGAWLAEVQKEGQRPFRIELSFAVAGDQITGMVRYPTGDAPVLAARLAGNVLTFHTSHVPQFESTPAEIRYQGELTDQNFRFTMTDQYGIGTGVARRRATGP